MNKNKWFLNGGRESGRAFRLLCETYENKIADLEKENAELKEQKEMLEKGYVWHDYDAGEDCYEDTHEGKWVKRDEVYQLTKAKEIIKELLNSCFGYNSKTVNYEVKAKAEQFLEENA